jgi:hypothetical protein
MSAITPRAMKQLKMSRAPNFKYLKQEDKKMTTMQIVKVKTKAMNEENEIERGASRRSRSKIITNFL